MTTLQRLNRIQYCGLYIVVMLFALRFVPREATADVWTNVAGHTIEASLVELRGEIAVLERSDRTRVEMPLKSLAESDRARAKEAWQVIQVPESLRTDYELCRRTLQRVQKLHEAGRLTQEELQLQETAAMSRFRKAMRKASLSDEEQRKLLLSVGIL